MSRFVLFFLLILGQLHASETYHDFDRIAYVEALADEETLVIFDVGNTLLESNCSWGHARSFVHAIAQAVKDGRTPQEFIPEFAPQWIEAQRYCSARLIESSLPLLIRRLQNRGIRVMALTHRPVETTASTLDQLNSLGIDLQVTAPYREQMDMMMPRGQTRYLEGVLFATYYNHKGWAVAEFLARSGVLPAKIIVVDDRRDKLEEVVSTLSGLGFYVKGVHYRYPEKQQFPWDQDISALQRKWMGSILGDAEALALTGFKQGN